MARFLSAGRHKPVLRVDPPLREAHRTQVRLPPPISARPHAAPDAAVRAPSRRMLAPSRERRAPSAGQLARRRILVSIAKRLLPLAAIGLLAAIALWPELYSAEDRGRVAFRRVVQAAPDALRIVDPRYQGVDEQNRPYTVTASLATQGGNEDVVVLNEPRADLLLDDTAWVYLESQRGHFDRPTNRLDLSGQVTVHHDDGTQFVTERAAIDLGAGAAAGDAPVAAQGPFGNLTAEGFRLFDRGQVVVFTGRARAVLEGGGQ